MKSLTLAVDIDGTFADYEDGLRNDLGGSHQVPASLLTEYYPPVTDYAMGNNGWHQMDTAEKFVSLHSQAVANGLFERLNPYAGAVDTVAEFHEQGHFIRFVTARFLTPGDCFRVMETSARFFEKNGVHLDDIAFTARKVDIMADVYIGDAPKNIMELTAAGRTVIIYDQPYNRHFEGLRAYNWDDVKRLVEEIANSSV